MKHLPLLLLCVAFAACQSTGKTGAADSSGISGTPADTATAVTYSGTLPCADCKGILTELSLYTQPGNAGNHFKMKETYQGKNQTFSSEGSYIMLHGSPSDPNAAVIRLNPDKDRNLQRCFLKVGDNELKLLDADLKEMDSQHNYSLKREL